MKTKEKSRFNEVFFPVHMDDLSFKYLYTYTDIYIYDNTILQYCNSDRYNWRVEFLGFSKFSMLCNIGRYHEI